MPRFITVFAPSVVLALFVVLSAPNWAEAQHFPPVFELEDVTSGSSEEGFAANGADIIDYIGTGLAVIGDINDDDYDDLAMSSDYIGAVYVIFGGPDIGDGNPIDLDDLDGTNGFVFDAGLFGGFGGAISPAGDFNNDGVDDIIVGARGLAPDGRTAAGGAYIIYGAPGIGAGGVVDVTNLDGTNGFVAHGILPFDQAGGAVGGGRDLNGDLISDVAIGAIQCSAHSTPLPGQVYVLFGGQGIGAGGTYELSSLPANNGNHGFIFDGIGLGDLPCDYFGASVSFLDDVNQDNYNDLAVGAPSTELNGNNYTGAAFVLYGGPNVAGNGLISASSLDGSNGFAMWGWSDHSSFGNRVRNAGDFNHDNIPDLAVGANALTVNNRTFCGATFVIFGQPGLGSSGTFDARTVNGSNGMAIIGAEEMDFSGRSLEYAHDVNGDGSTDLIIGAPSQTIGSDKTGQAYVAFGGPDVGGNGLLDLAKLDGTNGFRLVGYEIDSLTGYRVVGGLLNNDNLGDLVVAAPYSNANGTLSGQVMVVFGRNTPEPIALDIDPLVEGEQAMFRASDAETGLNVYFLYSLQGYGALPVPQLNITLGLSGPVKLMGSKVADSNGEATITRMVPNGSSGVTVYIQVCQLDNVSGVAVERIQ